MVVPAAKPNLSEPQSIMSLRCHNNQRREIVTMSKRQEEKTSTTDAMEEALGLSQEQDRARSSLDCEWPASNEPSFARSFLL